MNSSILETFHSVSRTVKAEIWCDHFTGRYIIEKFEGLNPETGAYIFVKKTTARDLESARDGANNWIENRD